MIFQGKGTKTYHLDRLNFDVGPQKTQQPNAARAVNLVVMCQVVLHGRERQADVVEKRRRAAVENTDFLERHEARDIVDHGHRSRH